MFTSLWRAASPIVAHSPGQRPGEAYFAINTFGIFAPAAQKCHAPRARNPQCRGALPLIMKAALTERDTLINALRFPRALPWAMGNNWAFSPPQNISQPATKYLSTRHNYFFETSIAPLSPVTANAITGEFFPFPLKFFPVCYDNFHFLGDIFLLQTC